MSRLQKLLSCLLILLLLFSTAGNVAFFFWGRHQARLATERQLEIESLRREIRGLRQQLQESRDLDPGLLQGVMDSIADQTEALRELESLTPPSRRLIDQEQMAQLISKKLDEGYAPEEAHRDELVLTTLELIPPGLDLYQTMSALLGEQAAGLYDPDDETLYVSTFLEGNGRMGPLEKSTFAHEYTHALQDQYFDLEALGMGAAETDWDDDQLLAIQSLVEGDAALAMQQYMTAHLKPLELVKLIGQAVGMDQEALDRTPPYLRASLLFPYQEGLLFVGSLFQQGGWAMVNTAYTDLPQSTEQIMHPERYPHDVPQVVRLPSLADSLAPEWQLVGENVLGEFSLRAYLGTYLSQSQAAQAASGWDGDQYVVYQNATSQQALLVLLLAWDDEAEMAEFVTIYREYAQNRFGDDLTQTDGADRTWWTGKNDVLLLAQGAAPDGSTRALIILAPDKVLAERILQEFSVFPASGQIFSAALRIPAPP